VEYLGPDMMTFATFKRRWVMKRPFRDLFQRFKTWNTSPNSAPRTPPQDGISPIRLSLAEVVDTMNAFGTILAFECDRPYESWYAAKVPFPLKEVKAFCAKPVFSDPGLKEFRESLRDYLDALDIDVTWRET